MKFGFDIDDTLINLREHAFEIYRKKLQADVPMTAFHDLKRVEIHEPFGLSEEEGHAMWKDTVEEIYYSDCPPFPEAVETLQMLDKEGHEIFYITARSGEHGERTKEWMKAAGFPVEDIRFFCGMKDHEKVHTIRKLGLDFYVDDKPAILETLKDIPAKLLLMDQSYNRDAGFARLTHWSELKEIVREPAK